VTHTLLPRLTTSQSFASPNGKLVYVQLVQTSGFNLKSASKAANGSTAVVRVTGEGGEVVLGEGDGVFIRGGETGGEVRLENIGKTVGEIVLFEMDA
jgi:hypothetical protein